LRVAWSSVTFGIEKNTMIICRPILEKSLSAILLLVLSAMVINTHGQDKSEQPKMTPEKVIHFTQHRFPIKSRLWNLSEKPEWSEKEKHWTIVLHIYKHSNWGHCRHTNGCTIVKQIRVVMDDNRKKILSKERSKSKFHNYE
jgi:hypothetical protein